MSAVTMARLFVAGVDHTTASLGRLAALHEARRTAGLSLPIEWGAGAVALATCHRLELYVEAMDGLQARRLFRSWLGEHPALEPVALRGDEEAARHLLRLAAGLESVALGEDEILRQLRDAYRVACGRRLSGPLLHRAFHAAFRTGRRVRHETALGAGTRSLAGAAMAEAHRRVGSLDRRTALVLGAGEMAAAACRLAKGRGIGRLMIANRTAARAHQLAASHGAEAVPWPWRRALLCSADLVVCATGAAEPVLEAAALERAAAAREAPIVVIDLGMPANVERTRAPGIDIIDLDTIAALLREQQAARAESVRAAQAIVEQELASWLAWRGSREIATRRAAGAAG